MGNTAFDGKTFNCPGTYASLNVCLDAAKAYVTANNNGTGKAAYIFLPDGTLSLTGPYTLQSGMQIQGIMPRLETQSGPDYNPVITMVANGGTWIDCGAAVCFTGTNVEGVKLDSLGFQHFTTALTLGGNTLPGLFDSTLTNLRFRGSSTVNASDKAIELYNSGFVTITSAYAYNVNYGLRVVSQNSTGFEPGNSVITDFYVHTYDKSVANSNNAKPGISLEVLTPSSGTTGPLLFLTFIRPQVIGGGDGTGIDFGVLGLPSASVESLTINGGDFENAAGATSLSMQYEQQAFITLTNGENVVLGAQATHKFIFAPSNISLFSYTDGTGGAGGNVLFSDQVYGNQTFNGTLALTTGKQYTGNAINLVDVDGNASGRLASYLTNTYLNSSAAGSIYFQANGTTFATLNSAAFAFNKPIVSSGTSSISGCSASSILGGSSAGNFVSGVTGTCTFTVTTNGPYNANSCWVNDITTTSDTIHQTGYTGSTATFSGTTVSRDVIMWGCLSF